MKNKIIYTLTCMMAFFYGNNPAYLKFVNALVIFMAFDISTGICKAIYLKKFKGGTLQTGFIKKIMILSAVSMCYFIDKYQIINAGINFESISAIFFIGGELISTLENFAEVGLKLPSKLIDSINKQFSQQESETIAK